MNRVFLVLGPARSGTSLVGSILHKLGIVMGEVMKGANPEWCKHGFFEDQEIDSAVSLVLKSHCCVKQGFIESINEWAPVYRLRELVERRKARYNKWGVKNLLLVWLMPQFDLWCRPFELSLIHCVRPFSETVDSLSVRSGSGLNKTIEDQANMLYICEKMYRLFAGPKMSVSYSDMLSNPIGGIQEIANFVGESYRDELVSLVDPTQRRFGK